MTGESCRRWRWEFDEGNPSVKKANYVDIVFGVPAQSRLVFQAEIFPNDNIVHRPRGQKKGFCAELIRCYIIRLLPGIN